jgi:hypothetical protein
MSIISISGRIKSGKNTVAYIIQYLFDKKLNNSSITFEEYVKNENYLSSTWEQKAFADKLKDIACMMLGCTRKDLESQTFKASYLPEEWSYIDEHGFKKQMTVREFLQRLGTNALRNNLHINVWVNSLMSNYTKTCKWIVTDTRYPNELKVLDKENALTIQVIRRDKDGLLYGKDYSKPEHPSECSLDVARFKYVIINDSDIKDLVYKVEKVLIAENLL